MTTPRSVHWIGWATYITLVLFSMSWRAREKKRKTFPQALKRIDARRFMSESFLRQDELKLGPPTCSDPNVHCSGGGGRKRIRLGGGDLGEAVGADYGGDGDHGVVAEVEKEAGEDCAGVGTGERENAADQDYQPNYAPAPAYLRS